MTKRDRQKGAALLIVLLLAATLSFVALATLEKTSLAAARAFNVNARSEALWRSLAVETLTVEAIEKFKDANDGRMSLDDEWAAAPIILPMDDGAARVIIADGTTCFNINSLSGEEGDASKAAGREFVRLAGFAGIDEYEAETLSQTIGDWIDADVNRRPQGAEDEYYSTLPSPYRAGNQPLATVSELRAIKGVTRERYAALKPYLCALSDSGPSPLNVNMLEPRDAPVLAAMLGEEVTTQTAADIISARPPGGWTSVEAFMETPQISALNLEDSSRFAVTSGYLNARAEIVYQGALLEMTSEIALTGGKARVLARRIGAEE